MTDKVRESTQKISLVGVCLECNQPAPLNKEDDVCPVCSGALSVVLKEKLDGQILDGAYRIENEIGSGAWGTVYRAEQISVGRTVAIKILHRHLVSNKNKVERFKHEAYSLKEIKHDGVAQLYDLGIMPDGRPYLVEEFVDGTSLQEIFTRPERLSTAQIKMLFGQILQTLQEMHARKIIHRDIKPGNIIVEAFASDEPRVKLLDFGIAKLGDSDSSLTSTGELMGTPLYMSPEQCVGDDLDGRSDIYSLGCVLYEALSGVPPYLAETSFQCMLAHVNDPVPELPDSSVSDQLETVVKTAMAKKPDQRFADAQQFGAALKAVPQETVGRKTKKSGKKTVLAVSIIVLLAVVGAAGWFASGTSGPPGQAWRPSDTPYGIAAVTPEQPSPKGNPQEFFEPTEDTLQARLTDITGKVRRGIEFTRKSGNVAGADAHAKQLENILASWADPHLLSNTPEMHVVGIEWGKQVDKFNHAGSAQIDINYKQAPIVLVISTYNMYGMDVRLNVAPGVRLKEIVTCGNINAKLHGVPNGVPVRSISDRDPGALIQNSEQFGITNFKQTLEKLMGLPMTTFLPDRAGKPFVIGPDDLEWRQRLLIGRLEKFARIACADKDKASQELVRNLRFIACVQNPVVQQEGSSLMTDTNNQKSFAAQFNVHGPIKTTIKDLHGSFSQIVADADPNIAWGLSDGRLYKIDLKTGQKTLIKTPDNIPDSFFGIAYLPETKEVLASAQWLSKYNPRTGKWSAAGDFPAAGHGLAYSRYDKCYYAFAQTNSSPGNVQTLYKISTDGKIVKRIRLSEPIPMQGDHIQTIATDKGVVALPLREILYGPEIGRDGNAILKLSDQFIFVIDPKTGDVFYKGKLTEQE